MVIQVDSREQKYEHVTRYFDSQGIKWVKSKCVVGDYVNLENPMVVIDRKKDLQELEFARELGYRLIVLVEEPTITTLTNVCSWYNWRRKKNPRAVDGKTLYKIMLTMSQKYGVEWQFTKKEDCGKRIIELLGGQND